MSAVWKYFTVNSDKDVAAKCNICRESLVEGQTGKVQYKQPHRTFEKIPAGKMDCLYQSAYI